MSAPQENDKMSIKISDIYTLCQYIDKAMKSKAFTKDEVIELYPIWNNIYKFCDDIKRKSEIEQVYKEEAEKKGRGSQKETTEPAKDASEPAKDASEPAKDASEPAKDASEPAKDASKKHPSLPKRRLSLPKRRLSLPNRRLSLPNNLF